MTVKVKKPDGPVYAPCALCKDNIGSTDGCRNCQAWRNADWSKWPGKTRGFRATDGELLAFRAALTAFFVKAPARLPGYLEAVADLREELAAHGLRFEEE